MSECDEPTDAEVNAAIDELAEKALRHVRGTSGHARAAESRVRRQAELLKRMLNATNRGARKVTHE